MRPTRRITGVNRRPRETVSWKTLSRAGRVTVQCRATEILSMPDHHHCPCDVVCRTCHVTEHGARFCHASRELWPRQLSRGSSIASNDGHGPVDFRPRPTSLHLPCRVDKPGRHSPRPVLLQKFYMHFATRITYELQHRFITTITVTSLARYMF